MKIDIFRGIKCIFNLKLNEIQLFWMKSVVRWGYSIKNGQPSSLTKIIFLVYAKDISSTRNCIN